MSAKMECSTNRLGADMTTDWNKQLVIDYEWSRDKYPKGKDKKRLKKIARTRHRRDVLKELELLEREEHDAREQDNTPFPLPP